ncbi:choline ABC transporter permease subunit, partial [Pantoea sp. SIMBA_072]
MIFNLGYWQETMETLAQVTFATVVCVVIGVPLGILMTRFPAVAGPLQASATVLLTIPSIALFGLLLPFY